MIRTNNQFQLALQQYFNRCALAGGEISDTEKRNLFNFISDLSHSFEWDDVYDIWSLREDQNAGTGTTAFGIKGDTDHDFVLTNAPAWGAEGIVLDGSNQYLVAGNAAYTTFDYYAIFALVKPITGAGNTGLLNSTYNGAVLTERLEITHEPGNNRFIIRNSDGATGAEKAIIAYLDKWNLVYGYQNTTSLVARTYHNVAYGTLANPSGVLSALKFGSNSVPNSYFKGTLGFAMILHRDTPFTEDDGYVVRTAIKRHLFSDVTTIL